MHADPAHLPTDRLDLFVETSAANGRNQNANEVVREGLRLLEQRHQEDMLKLRHLRKAIQEGEDPLTHKKYRDLDLDELQEVLTNLGVPERSNREHRLWWVSG